ncbi:MAG: Rv3654c family TadE-like protein [Pseudolysinimonas sp.]
MRDERGAGTVLALALVGATVIVALAVLGLAAGLSARQQVIGTADSASLAAADAASGALAGDPCGLAARVSAATAAVVTACRSDGLVVTIEVSRRFGPMTIHARSTAGPAG